MSSNNEKFNKRIYSFNDLYRYLVAAMRSFKYFSTAKKSGVISEGFRERIMLAVTEVNGCEMCSYMHTNEALKNGMSEAEISMILAGSFDNIPPLESVGIFFAQHYAENAGKPTKEAWKRLESEYGKEKALAILGAIRVIMVGNVHGIAFGALKNRFKGKPTEKTSLGYELLMTLGIIVLLPIAFISSNLKNIMKVPILSY